MPELYNTYDEYVKANPQKGSGQSRMSKAQWENAKKAKGETIPEENNDPFKGYKKATADKLREQADKKDAGKFAGLTASDRTADEDRAVADALENKQTKTKSDFTHDPSSDMTWAKLKEMHGNDPEKIAAWLNTNGAYVPGNLTKSGMKELGYELKNGKWVKVATSDKEAPEMYSLTLPKVDGMTEKEQQTLWEKLKGKLTNKDLEQYAKENGITYGQALRYTLASVLKGMANAQQPITGVKPFGDEETLTPLQKRYRVTSGKVDEENAITKAEQKFLKDAETRKEASTKRGEIEGRSEGAKEIGNIVYKNDNGQEMVDFANLQATIKDISDAQELKTLEKKLGLERESSMALQKFLSELSVNAAYRMGWNNIQLEKDKIKALGDYLVQNPDAIENYKDFSQEMVKSGLTEAQVAGQWIDTVIKPVSALVEAGAEGVTRGAKGGL